MPGEAAPAPRNLVQICGDGLIFDGDAERCICFGDPVQEVWPFHVLVVVGGWHKGA